MRQGTAALLLATLAFITTSALAQTPRRPEFKRYVGEVVGRDVYVRSGPDESLYHATRLSHPTRVTVVGRERTWLSILPPAGCYSVVLKDNVDVDATGKAGVIKGTHVWAHPGGFPAKPGNFAMLQKTMKPGDKVVVLGEIDKFYKIHPPKGAYLWIAAAHVRRATAPARPARPKPVRVPSPPKGPSRPVRKATVPDANPDLTQIRALDKQWTVEYEKPWTQRDFQSLLKKYQAVKLPKGSRLAPVLKARIRRLQTEIRRVADVRAVEKLVQANAARRDDYLKRAAKAAVAPPPPGSPAVPFSAQGVVAASRAFPASKAVPGRFVLRDTKAFRVLAYLRSRGAVKLSQYAGKLVGVYGKIEYDPVTHRRLITVQKIVVLQPKATVPSLPKPTVKVVKIPKPTTRPAKARPATSRPAGAKGGKTKAAPPKGRKPRDTKA